jgi:helix-turn-helix protein
MKALKDDLKSGPNIARMLDVDAATLRRWRREGCPFHDIGHGLIRFRLSEVLAWRATRPPNPFKK